MIDYKRYLTAFAERIKKFITIRNMRITLFALACALALTAGGIFYAQWQEGETAARNAQALLNASGVTASASITSNPESAPAAGASAASAQATSSALPSDLQGYTVIARLDIGKLDLSLPVLSETTDKALTVSACRYQGPEPGGQGNLVITGHDYRSGAIFGNLSKLAVGDAVSLTAKDGKTYSYAVYAIDHINSDDAQALDDAKYTNELSLLTCELSGNGRLLVRCRETSSLNA